MAVRVDLAVSGRNLVNRDPESQAGFVAWTPREYEADMARLEADYRLMRKPPQCSNEP